MRAGPSPRVTRKSTASIPTIPTAPNWTSHGTRISAGARGRCRPGPARSCARPRRISFCVGNLRPVWTTKKFIERFGRKRFRAIWSETGPCLLMARHKSVPKVNNKPREYDNDEIDTKPSRLSSDRRVRRGRGPDRQLAGDQLVGDGRYADRAFRHGYGQPRSGLLRRWPPAQ